MNFEIGNAAKMREALMCFVHDFASFRSNVEHGIVSMTQCMDFVKKYIPLMEAALSASPHYCDVMSLESARKLWFAKEIIPRLDGDLPLGKEVPFEEWFVSKLEQ